MNAPRSLREVIGERVRHLREAGGKRQEDLARSARAAGLAWSRSKVASLERGDKAVSLEEFFLLPVILNWTIGTAFTSWEELFDTDGVVRLTDRMQVSARQVPNLLKYEVAEAFVEPTAEAAQFPDLAWEQAKGRCRGFGINEPPESFGDVLRDSGEAERRAAKRLKEDPGVYAAISAHLWGRTMSAENVARIEAPPIGSPAQLQAYRGRVTRQLDKEVRDFITAAGGPPAQDNLEE